MKSRTRKLIGTIALLAMLPIYSLIVATAAAAFFGRSGAWVQLAFYVIGGLAWVLPAAMLVKWMSRNDEGDS